MSRTLDKEFGLRPLEIEYRAVQDLKSYARNARVHPKKQIAALAQSIRAFGFVSPVLIDEDGELIAGHGRVLAAKSLRMTEVPAIVLRGLSDFEKRALRLADNKLPQGAAWDPDLVRGELEALSNPALEFDIRWTGFTTPEVDHALRGWKADINAGAKADCRGPQPSSPSIGGGAHALLRLNGRRFIQVGREPAGLGGRP